jgi:hypothetical protein
MYACASVSMWKATPFCTRPARPRRCSILSREIQTGSSEAQLLAAS